MKKVRPLLNLDLNLSLPRSLRPRWKTVLNTLPHFIIPAIQVFNFSENLPRVFARCGLAGRTFLLFPSGLGYAEDS